MDPQPAPPQLPQIPHPPKQSPFIPILLALLILLAGATAFLSYRNMQLQKQITETIPTPTPHSVPTPTPTVTIDTKTGWKLYSNTKYGYSLEYPPDWKIDLGIGEGTGDDSKLETISAIRLNSTTIPADQLEVWVSANQSNYKNIDEFSNQAYLPQPNSDSTTVISKNKTVLNGIEALKVVRSQEGVGQVMEVIAIKKDYEYSLSVNHPDTQSQNIQLFNQILSTFTFLGDTNPTNSGSNCQNNGITYNNGEAVPSCDSCNSCACDNGRVACTTMACP